MRSFTRLAIAASVMLSSSVLYSSAVLADTTATVNLGGTVTSTLAITSTPTGTASALTLGGAGTDVAEQIVKVSDLGFVTNNSGGLRLAMTSGNITSGTGTTSIPFKVVTVADSAAAPATGAFATASGTERTEDFTTGFGSDGTLARDLYISYDPPQLVDPGAYTGSISLTVTDL